MENKGYQWGEGREEGGRRRKKLVMVHFMCQLDWALGCPDTWSNIVLGFLVEVNI